LKKKTDNIDSLNEVWRKKKTVFAHSLLSYGTAEKARAHLQITRADIQNKNCKKKQFLPTHKALLKFSTILILLLASSNIHAQNNYITTVELNLRSAAEKNSKSIIILEKGDTVKLLDHSGDYWAKIQYQDKIGYSEKQYLQKIDLVEEIKTETKCSKGFIIALICLLIVIMNPITLEKSGEKYRYKSVATLLSLFFGAFGFQKFYLGEKIKGRYSILICWTLIPLLIGFIDFIELAMMKRTEFKDLYNWGKSPLILSSKHSNTTKPEKKESEIEDNLKENIEIAIIPSVENNSIFIPKISMHQVQEDLVKMIANNSYEIQQDVVDKYATENGMFKNQLIDSINKACEEHLDNEALIEEDDENYIIEESYYKEIIK
jgi:TM2 domain-containing membrane protein YozV